MNNENFEKQRRAIKTLIGNQLKVLKKNIALIMCMVIIFQFIPQTIVIADENDSEEIIALATDGDATEQKSYNIAMSVLVTNLFAVDLSGIFCSIFRTTYQAKKQSIISL